jgi:hypothetical protein
MLRCVALLILPENALALPCTVYSKRYEMAIRYEQSKLSAVTQGNGMKGHSRGSTVFRWTSFDILHCVMVC